MNTISLTKLFELGIRFEKIFLIEEGKTISKIAKEIDLFVELLGQCNLSISKEKTIGILSSARQSMNDQPHLIIAEEGQTWLKEQMDSIGKTIMTELKGQVALLLTDE